MDEPTRLDLERVKRAPNNCDIAPRELLEAALDTIDRNELNGKPIRAVLIIETEMPNGLYGVEMFRAGCSRYEEITLLELAKTRIIEIWRSDG